MQIGQESQKDQEIEEAQKITRTVNSEKAGDHKVISWPFAVFGWAPTLVVRESTGGNGTLSVQRGALSVRKKTDDGPAHRPVHHSFSDGESPKGEGGMK